MANSITKNFEKATTAGISSALALISTYIICKYLNWDLNYLSASMILVLTAAYTGIGNAIKHRRK